MTDGLTFGRHPLKFNPQLYARWKKRFARFVRLTRTKTSGLENILATGPAVLAPNHLSWKDIIFIGTVIQKPVTFVATFRLFDATRCQEMLNQYFGRLAGHPLLQKPIRRLNTVLAKFLVDRVSQSGAMPAKLYSKEYSFEKAVKDALRQNRLVCVFPEGRTGSPRKLNRFKLGISKVLYSYYRETQQRIPVFPVGITGTHRLYHPGMKLGLHVGATMYIEDYIQPTELQTLAKFTDELQKAVYDLINST